VIWQIAEQHVAAAGEKNAWRRRLSAAGVEGWTMQQLGREPLIYRLEHNQRCR
jgi:hypothetical protein